MRTDGGLEHLIPNQGVAGSSPAGVANDIKKLIEFRVPQE
jgi:hypothetical protein